MTNAELIKAIRDNEECNDCAIAIHDDCNERRMSFAAAYALEVADKRIAELEAQLPKEGEWKEILQNRDGTSDYQCSACLGIIMDVPYDDEHPLCSFCPNCGARMRGEHDEH